MGTSLVSFYGTTQGEVCFAWIVSFFETNQVITGEEEEGLTRRFSSHSVSFLYLLRRGHKSIHPDQSPQFSFLRLLPASNCGHVGYGSLVGKDIHYSSGCRHLPCMVEHRG